MLSNVDPYESWEKDGTTITVIKQFPDNWPDEHLQWEYKRIKKEFGAVLLEAIERTNSRCVIEYSEEFPSRSRYGIRSGFQIIATIKPVKYMDVTYSRNQHENIRSWVVTKPRTFREKLSKWIAGK